MYTAIIAIGFSALMVVALSPLVLAEYIANLLGLGPIATIFIYFVVLAMLLAAANTIDDRKKICG
jgi:hypothetical protein